MTYKILKGEELSFEYLQKIMDIDKEVYSHLGMEGALEQMEKRYRKNKETFVVLENAESGETAGYINFFPVNEKTFQDIMHGSEQIRDDDIEPEEMAENIWYCVRYDAFVLVFEAALTCLVLLILEVRKSIFYLRFIATHKEEEDSL